MSTPNFTGRPPHSYAELRTPVGQLTGFCEKITYPSHTPANVHFRRGVDWMTTAPQFLEKYSTIPKEYQREEWFRADNDDGFNNWKKELEIQKHIKKQLQLSLAEIPPNVKAQPGHSGPIVTETSSQVIGQFHDLAPSKPLEYPDYLSNPVDPPKLLVSFLPNNFSNRPDIPDHPFLVPDRDLYPRPPIGDTVFATQPELCRADDCAAAEPSRERPDRMKRFDCKRRCRVGPRLTKTGLELERFNAGKGGSHAKWVDACSRNEHFPRNRITDAVGFVNRSKPMELELLPEDVRHRNTRGVYIYN